MVTLDPILEVLLWIPLRRLLIPIGQQCPNGIAFDLLDRTPNVDQITKEANPKYYHACEQPYESASKVIDKYIELLKSPEFQVAVEKQTKEIREKNAKFREQVERAAGVRFLSKFK